MELLYQLVESIKLRLYVGISHPVLNGYTGLHNFVFDMLILGGMFTILMVREKNYFLKSVPSKTLMAYMRRFFGNFNRLKLWTPGLMAFQLSIYFWRYYVVCVYSNP
jgi:hypothetical protein